MKKAISNNKAIFLMITIIFICAVLSIILLFKYFYFGNGGTKYGDRLDGIEEVLITDTDKDNVINTLKESEDVEDCSVLVTGRIIYIKIVFKPGYDLTLAKSEAAKTIDLFSDDKKAYYDFSFTIESAETEDAEGFLLMGAKNKNGTNLVWNNNNTTVTDEEDK